MFFIIQQETIGRDPVQNAIVMDVINHNSYSHSHSYEPLADANRIDAARAIESACALSCNSIKERIEKRSTAYDHA